MLCSTGLHDVCSLLLNSVIMRFSLGIRSTFFLYIGLGILPGILVGEDLAGDAGYEPVLWLQEYVQIDTTNPPGNEAVAAEYLASRFEAAGIATRRLVDPNGRTSLYARIESPASQGRALALIHHIDVVPADGEWQEPPFSGRLRDGTLWGRGVVDVKSLGIAQLAAILSLVRDGVQLDRDLIYLAVADEELGGKAGAAFVLENHADLFAGLEGVLNEGGSNRVIGDRLLWWGVEVTQKRALWLRVSARGRGGHGSQLNPQSATHELIRGLGRLVDRPQRFRITEAARRYLEAVDAVESRPNPLSARLDEVIQEDGPTETLAPGLPALFLDTVQVTEIDNGRGPNVVSPTARASIDIRLLPDTDAEAFLESVRETLGSRLDVEVVLTSPPVDASPADHPLFLALEDALGVRAPVVPMMMTGITDSRYFRQRGIPAYGFSPFSLDRGDVRGIHAPNESMSAEEFLRGIETLRRVIVAYAGSEEP